MRKREQTMQSILNDSEKANMLVKTLIDHFDTLFALQVRGKRESREGESGREGRAKRRQN